MRFAVSKSTRWVWRTARLGVAGVRSNAAGASASEIYRTHSLIRTPLKRMCDDEVPVGGTTHLGTAGGVYSLTAREPNVQAIKINRHISARYRVDA